MAFISLRTSLLALRKIPGDRHKTSAKNARTPPPTSVSALLFLLSALPTAVARWCHRCVVPGTVHVQVGVDVFIIDPVFGFIFVWSTGIFEGRSAKHDILHTLQYNYPTMVLWLIVIGLAWAPLQIYLFNRYPVQYRVLLADLIDLVWTCVSSFFCHAR